MILARYITKEVLLSFMAVTGVLLLVSLSNRFVVYLAKAAVGQMPAELIFKTVGLYIPEFLALLAPLGLFVGILLAHGRMHADNEMTVMLIGGINWAKILTITLKLALLIAALVWVLMAWVLPTVIEHREETLAQGEAQGLMQAISPGQFQVFNDGKMVFYVEDVSKDKAELSRVFIADQTDGSTDQDITTVTANAGHLKRMQDGESYFIILNDGHRYTGKPGTSNYTTIDFAEYGRELKTTAAIVPEFDRLKPTNNLWHSSDLGDKAELQWRLGMPLSVLILTVIAVPLARVSPRQGRFAKFLPAILIYIAYYNLMMLAKRWVATGVLTPVIGIWSVHFMFLLLGGLILAHTSGRLNQFYQNYIRRKTKSNLR